MLISLSEYLTFQLESGSHTSPRDGMFLAYSGWCTLICQPVANSESTKTPTSSSNPPSPTTATPTTSERKAPPQFPFHALAALEEGFFSDLELVSDSGRSVSGLQSPRGYVASNQLDCHVKSCWDTATSSIPSIFSTEFTDPSSSRQPPCRSRIPRRSSTVCRTPCSASSSTISTGSASRRTSRSRLSTRVAARSRRSAASRSSWRSADCLRGTPLFVRVSPD